MIRVPAYGPLDARIAIVGETPAKNEERLGRPFVGLSGDKLEAWLAGAGIVKSDCYLTNACKYRAPADPKRKAQFFFGKTAVNAKAPLQNIPSPLYLEGISELVQELNEVNPIVVFALGNYALWALTQKWGISKWRGSILESTLIPGLKVIPSLHPAGIMRGRWSERVLFIWDATRVRAESNHRELTLPERDLIVYPTEDQIATKIEDVLSTDSFTWDTEWYDAKTPSCFGFTNDPSWAVCVPMHYTTSFPAISQLLSSDAIKIAQNAMFDVTYMGRQGVPTRLVDDEGNFLIRDTMVAWRVCWPDFLKGLGTITSVCTREPYFKDDHKFWPKDEREERQLFEYNCKDNATTQEAWNYLEREMKTQGTRRAYDLNMLLFQPLAESTITGLRCDMPKLIEMMATADADAATIQGLLNDITGAPLNVRSQPQVAELVYDRLKIKERAKRSTNQLVLMDIAAQHTDPDVQTILAAIIKLRRILKRRSAYIREELMDLDGRVRGSWDMAGTKNGRRSQKADTFSRKARRRGASLQTFPEEVRQCIIPDKNHTFIGHDYAQAEARVVAHRSDDDLALKWYAQGLNAHSMLAEILFGIPHDHVNTKSREYALSKSGKHGVNYGEGPRMLQLAINKYWLDTGIGVTFADCKDLIKRIHNTHPSVRRYQEWIRQELGRNQYIDNPFGRRRRFTYIWGDELFKDAYAYYPQSTIADLNAVACKSIWDEFHEHGVQLLIDLHDGALWSVPDPLVDDFTSRMRYHMELPITVGEYTFTIPLEGSIGDRWSDLTSITLPA